MSKPIPIIYIHHEKALGGAPLSLLYLIRQLDRAKYTPQIICLREGPAAELFRKEDIPVQIVPGPDLSHTELVWFRWWQFPRLLWRMVLSISLFFRLLRHLKTLILHPSSFIPPPFVHLNSSTLITAAFAAQCTGLKVVWHIREPLARGYLGVRRAFLRAGIRKWANQVIAISQNDADQLGNVPSSRLTVIHNFVDFKQFNSSPLSKPRPISPPNARVVLFLGGDSSVKGFEILLKAAPQILAANETYCIKIAGETSRLKSDIEPRDPAWISNDHATKFGNRIEVLGPRRDIPELLAASDLLVFPSVVPHFARPVIEAAAMGKPVVASDLGGVRELVLPGETGLLVPPGDPGALAKAVRELLDDPARCEKMGKRALALAHEKFDASRNASRTFEIYERVTAV